MKNKKPIIIIAAVLIICFGLTVCGVGGWLLYQKSLNDAADKAKLLVEISDNFSKTKVDFMFLQTYFTDNGLYSVNLANHKTDVDAITGDINYNKTALDVLSAQSKSKLIDYYTRISSILQTKRNQNANYDAYYALFTNPNSDWEKSLNDLSTLYTHKVESLTDVADIISKYNSIIATKQNVKTRFLAIDIPEEQAAYKLWNTNIMDYSIEYVTNARDIYQNYYNAGTLPGTAYDLLTSSWNTYSGKLSQNQTVFDAAMVKQQKDMADAYNAIIDLGAGIVIN